jgi:hypothetical protein
MARTTKCAAAASALLVAVSAAPRASSAEESAPAPQPPTLRLAAGTTYVYRYVQDATLVVRSKELRLEHTAFAGGDDGSLGAKTNLRIEWQVGVKLVEVRSDDSVVVTLLPMRASGAATFGGATPPPPGVRFEPIPPMKFDSDDVDRPPPSPFVGRALVVRLSRNAHVLEATPAPLAPTKPGAQPAVEKIGPAAASDFAQRFFQELPTSPPDPKSTWDARRRLSPEIGYVHVDVVDLGAVDETATVTRCEASAFSAAIRGKAVQATPVAGPSVASPWRTNVLAADVSGEATISRATGLARSRATRAVVKAHRDEVKLAGGTFVDSGLIPRRIELPKSSPAQDEEYEIETRLECVDAH